MGVYRIFILFLFENKSNSLSNYLIMIEYSKEYLSLRKVGILQFGWRKSYDKDYFRQYL